MPIFELRRAIPVKSHVWKFGLDCLKSEVCIFKGGRNPLLGGLHVTCDPHLRTWPSYSSQKSCVKIWFGLLKPFKSYRVHKHFPRGAEDPLFGGFTCDLWCPFSNSDVLFQSKVMCENLVWIGWNRRCAFSRVGAETPYQERYMWPAIPIFELGRAIPVKSHVWKFGSDWLSLSGVIVSTNIFPGAETPIRGVTFDLWCPFSNSGVLFQSKVMC